MSTYVHNIDPFAIELNWNILGFHIDGIRWYGLAYLAGFIAGYLVIRALAKKKKTSVGALEAADFITMVAVGTMVGGRLGYCLFYAPHLFWEFGGGFPFWGVLKVHEGGMASHGGIIGIVTVCILWARKYRHDMFHLFDLVVYGGTLGVFFGRIANFINGELYGREAPQGFSWAVKFPQEMILWTRNEVGRLMDIAPAVESLGKVMTDKGAIILNQGLWRSWVEGYHRDLYSYQMVNATLEQIITAIQGGNTILAQALAPFLTARYPSQLYQAVMEGLLVFVILFLIWLKPRKPGVVSAWFGLLYAVARIAGEQFRMPDAHIGFQALGLTRGQWLSIVMFAIFLVYLAYVIRRPAEKMGGWR